MTESQRTYHQKNGTFRATVSNNIQQDFGITLPSSFDNAVRTTTEAATPTKVAAGCAQLTHSSRSEP